MHRMALFIVFPLVACTVHAQIGGNGRDGALAPVGSVALDTGQNGGVFNFTRIQIPRGASVTIRGPNPAVLLSQGNVSIAGRISVDASAALPGPGGFAGGRGTRFSFQRGKAGSGPGGGTGGVIFQNTGCESGGAAGHATPGRRETRWRRWCMSPGAAYGRSLPFDMRGGSGGGGACGTTSSGNGAWGPYGGGGGGIIAVLADGSIQVDGVVTANGGDTQEVRGSGSRLHAGGPGAGGSILLRSMLSVRIAPTAQVRALGGYVSPYFYMGRLGGDGFVRFDSHGRRPSVRGTVEPKPLALELPHLFETISPRVGKTHGIACAAVPGDIVGIFMATKGADIPIPPLGTLRIDPTANLVYLGGAVTPTKGHDPIGNLVVPVHDDIKLAGLVLHLQGINLLTKHRQPRLTSVVVTRISR